METQEYIARYKKAIAYCRHIQSFQMQAGNFIQVHYFTLSNTYRSRLVYVSAI